MYNPRIDKAKDNKFCVVLYPDSVTYNFSDVIANIQSISTYYAYIRHDSDIDKEGNQKKAHIHVFFRTSSQRSRAAVSLDIGISVGALEYSISERGSLRYLLHLDDVDKFQYSYTDIVSNFPEDKLTKYFVDDDANMLYNINEIFNYISENNCKSFTQLLKWGLSTRNPYVVRLIYTRSFFWGQIFNEH